jgi:ribosomal-protein-alanine N-acetyltransferase
MVDNSEYEINTDRLRLRLFLESDLDEYYLVMSQDEVGGQLPKGTGFTFEETTTMLSWCIDGWKNNGFGVWAVVDMETNTLMGHCGLNTVTEMDQVEVMYALGKEYWGRGYATEAAQASVEWGFANLEIDEIIGLAKTDNPASQKVLVKCGLEEVDRVHLWGLDLVKFLRAERGKRRG